jgi:hypothetical protein
MTVELQGLYELDGISDRRVTGSPHRSVEKSVQRSRGRASALADDEFRRPATVAIVRAA